MIVDGLLMLITGIVQWVYDLLPDWDITTNFSTPMKVDGMGFTPLGGYVEGATAASPLDYALATMWQLNKFIPMDHFVAALSIVVTIWVGTIAFKTGKFIIGVIRGAGTS